MSPCVAGSGEAAMWPLRLASSDKLETPDCRNGAHRTRTGRTGVKWDYRRANARGGRRRDESEAEDRGRRDAGAHGLDQWDIDSRCARSRRKDSAGGKRS